jgi:O-acetyl-ADP-ribose deacetylase (regulator of RNase III)
VKADYQAIRKVMRSVKARFAGKRIGYPKIGAGLAGGDWETIASIIEDELAGEDHTLVEYAA